MEGLAKSQNVIHGREEMELPDQLLSFASAEGTGGEVHPQAMCCSCLLLQNKADTSLSHWLEFKPRTIISFAYKSGGRGGRAQWDVLAEALSYGCGQKVAGAGLALNI